MEFRCVECGYGLGKEKPLFIQYSPGNIRLIKCILMNLILGNSMFLCTLVFLTRFFCNTTMGVSRFKEILLAICISSYFKIFLIAMMVWEFPSSVLLITDIFVV